MRAAVIRQHGPIENIQLEDDFPDPTLSPGWVRIAVRACSLNYHDIFSRRGMPGIRLPLPLITGSDIAGEVVELGEGVTDVATGQRVLLDPLFAPMGMIGERFHGGRAEQCAAHASQLIVLPDSVSFEEAAAIPLAYATAHRMMLTRGGVAEGETVLVYGASGGVGTACVLLAKAAGARVIACASSDAKIDRLQDLGSDFGINYAATPLREAVWEITGKPRISGEGGVDLVINSNGGGTWTEALRCMKVGARLVTCGATAGFEEQIDVRYLWTFEHTLLGSNGWRRRDIESMLDHAARRTLVPVVDRVMSLGQVHEAERLMEDREVFGKIVLVP